MRNARRAQRVYVSWLITFATFCGVASLAAGQTPSTATPQSSTISPQANQLRNNRRFLAFIRSLSRAKQYSRLPRSSRGRPTREFSSACPSMKNSRAIPLAGFGKASAHPNIWVLHNPPGPLWPYRIDTVAEGANDARLAIECGGDRSHGPDKWLEDAHRQRVLERAGWVFWRCFASAWTRRREERLEDLLSTLRPPVGRPARRRWR